MPHENSHFHSVFQMILVSYFFLSKSVYQVFFTGIYIYIYRNSDGEV